MKKTLALTILNVTLCALVFLSSGCAFFSQPGETTDEGHRRHLGVLNTNRQMMMEDIDKVLLLDRPSRLTENRIP